MESGFPSPPPPMEEVVAAWEAAFIPARDDFESVSIVARGKAAHAPMTLQAPEGPSRRLSAMIPGRDSMRRVTSPMPSSSSASVHSGGGGYQGRNNLRIPSAGGYPSRPHSPAASDRSSYASSPPASSYSGYSGHQGPKRLEYLAPTDFTQATALSGNQVDRTTLEKTRPFPRSPSASTPSINRAHSPQALRTPGINVNNGNGNGNGNDYFALAVAKKRPPPPPPPKRIASAQQPAEYVVALYTFPGQGAGDLAFNEGDRIKIVKKTNTDQDWWVGELNGKKGNFPANYCKKA